MLKRLSLFAIFSAVIFLLNLGSVARAGGFAAVSDIKESPVLAATSQELIQDLKTQLIPEVQKILTPEQGEQLEAAVLEGKQSLRKVFKTIGLTPDQKTKLASTFKSMPSKEILSSMTPEEKKAFFLKKKGEFKPTPEEIGDKISAKMKLAKDKSPFIPSPESITAKISKKMEKMKEQLLPSSGS